MYSIKKLKSYKTNTDDIGRMIIDDYISVVRTCNEQSTPKRYKKGYGDYHCGHCDHIITDYHYKYCPYCGGKLIEDEI